MKQDSTRKTLTRGGLMTTWLFSLICAFATPSQATTNHHLPETHITATAEIKESQQTRLLKGVIKDEEGFTIPGANILIKGTTTGVATDHNGHFTIELPESAILVITYIGFITQEVQISKEQQSVEITLVEDKEELDEVVVIGYGTVKKSDLTGAVSYISSKEFNQGVAATPDQLLTGKVPGLTISRGSGDPSARPNIQLRGPSSLSAGTEPFYVIDGVPGASINLVSPSDIMSINILKDASSTAIYGSRAANGVILVTTKKGTVGKPIISYNGYAAMESVANRLSNLTADEHRQFLKEHNMTIPKSEDGFNTDWQRELLHKVGVSQSHSVSLTGGVEQTRYNFSVNFLANPGIVKNTKNDRFIVRAGVDQDALNDRLHLSLSLSNSMVSSEHIDYNIFNYAGRYLPESPVRSDDPAYEKYDGYFEVSGRMGYYNPVAILNKRNDVRFNNTFQGLAKIGLDITDDLTFNLLSSMQRQTVDYSSYKSVTDVLFIGKGHASRQFLKHTDKVLEATLDYGKTFHLHHNLKAMLGYSYQETINDDGIKGANDHFTSDALGANNLSVGDGDKVIHFSGYPKIKESKLISFFGRFNYDYKGKYLVTATLRRDGSSKFGLNNKWAMFPSLSAAWRISQESFMQNQTLFYDLKLRAGYGKSGNQNIDPYSSITLYGPESSQFMYQNNWISSYGVQQNPNPDLKWESTSMTNIGVDFSILKGRVTGTVDLYRKETNDMLYTYDVPSPPYQFNKLLANGASMINRGVEMMVNVIAYDRPDFSWSTSVNFAANNNVIGSLSSNVSNLNIAERFEGNMYLEGWTAQTVSLVKPGLPLGAFYTFKYAGYDEQQQKTLYENKAGEIVTIDKLKTPDDYQVVGTALPKATYGWNNTFRYKQWDLNIFLRGVAGNKIFNATRADLSRLSQASITNISREAVKDGIMEAPQSSSRWLEDGAFIRLDNATVGYTFNLQQQVLLKQCRLYLTAQNLFTITKYTGIDPEVNLSGLAPGIDNRNYYPKTRSLLLGINVSF